MASSSSPRTSSLQDCNVSFSADHKINISAYQHHVPPPITTIHGVTPPPSPRPSPPPLTSASPLPAIGGVGGGGGVGGVSGSGSTIDGGTDLGTGGGGGTGCITSLGPIETSTSTKENTKNCISSSLKKGKGRLIRMLSVDQDRGESLHQQQLNLQHHYQQKGYQQIQQQQSLPSTIGVLSTATTHIHQQGHQHQHQQHQQTLHHQLQSEQPKPKHQNASSSGELSTNVTTHHLQPILKSPRQTSPIQQYQFKYQSFNHTPVKHIIDDTSQNRRLSHTYKHARSASTSSQFSKNPYLPITHHHQHGYLGHHPKQAAKAKRNLSEEGWLRVQTFQQTHSASSALGTCQKSLRFSADNSVRKCSPSTNDEITTSKNHSRSASCLPFSRFKGFSTSRENAPHRSFDRLSLSPKKSFDNVECSPSVDQLTCSRHRIPEKICDKCNSFRSRGSSAESRELPQLNTQSPTEPTTSVGQSSTTGTSGTSGTSSTPTTSADTRSRRSQFRRAISLFSLSCDKETERNIKDKGAPQKILRPPTRHFYRKGHSGLPIECGTRTMTIAY